MTDTHMAQPVLTVGELKSFLQNIPDNRTVFVFDTERSTHHAVIFVSDDKRVGSVNLWIEPLDSQKLMSYITVST